MDYKDTRELIEDLIRFNNKESYEELSDAEKKEVVKVMYSEAPSDERTEWLCDSDFRHNIIDAIGPALNGEDEKVRELMSEIYKVVLNSSEYKAVELYNRVYEDAMCEASSDGDWDNDYEK